MTVLIVGADRLGNIPQRFRDEGAKEIIHWSGRSRSYQNKTIPQKVDRVVMLCDFLNHRLMENVKRHAKKHDIPVTYIRRSLSDIISR